MISIGITEELFDHCDPRRPLTLTPTDSTGTGNLFCFSCVLRGYSGVGRRNSILPLDPGPDLVC